MPRTCPKCGHFSAHRSHSRNIIESFAKAILPFRPYHCSTCEWRGWKIREKNVNKKKLLNSILFYVLVFFIAVLFAFWVKGQLQ